MGGRKDMRDETGKIKEIGDCSWEEEDSDNSKIVLMCVGGGDKVSTCVTLEKRGQLRRRGSAGHRGAVIHLIKCRTVGVCVSVFACVHYV